MKTRKRIVRELHFRTGSGCHGKSEKAKRRAETVKLRKDLGVWRNG